MCDGNRYSYTVGQANQKGVLSIASMQSIVLLGWLRTSPRKIFKTTCSKMESEGILKKI